MNQLGWRSGRENLMIDEYLSPRNENNSFSSQEREDSLLSPEDLLSDQELQSIKELVHRLGILYSTEEEYLKLVEFWMVVHNRAYEEGYDQGDQDGYITGYQVGYDQEVKNVYDDAYEKGYEEGLIDGSKGISN